MIDMTRRADSKESVDREALNQFSKDQLIALLLAQEARIAELERRLGLNSSNSDRVAQRRATTRRGHNAPNPVCYLSDTDIVRASKRQHPVQGSGSKANLGRLGSGRGSEEAVFGLQMSRGMRHGPADGVEQLVEFVAQLRPKSIPSLPIGCRGSRQPVQHAGFTHEGLRNDMGLGDVASFASSTLAKASK